MKSFLNSFSKKMGKTEIQNYTEASLFPVLSADRLVPAVDQKSYLAKLNETLQMPVEHFEALYKDLLTNFIEYVQILPDYYGGHLGSMIYEGMHRAHLAVQLLYDTHAARPEPILTYAVFSMSLLLDIKLVMATQKVMVSDEKGHYLFEWCPFNGSMVGRGEYFKIRPYSGHREAFLHSINPILAKDLLPEVGVAWLTTDSALFDMWIAALSGHADWAGELGHIHKLLKKLMDELRAEALDEGFVDVEAWVPEETQDAEKFWKWLKDGVEDGSISVNEKDSLVHVLDDGVYIDVPEIYQAYNNTYAKHRDWIVLQLQFNNLGLPMLSGYDYKHMQHFSEKCESAARLGFLTGKQSVGHENLAAKSSMIIKDKGMLFSDKSSAPESSKYMKGSKVNWSRNSSLPKLAGSVAAIKQQQMKDRR